MSKQYYGAYLADNNLSKLSHQLIGYILNTNPTFVLEFGCGTGKNLKKLTEKNNNIKPFGIDISPLGILHGNIKNELPYLAIGDEDWLPRFSYMDVVFTCSVLDHIENVGPIIKEFKRIGKHVFLAETNDVPGDFYYPHDYESYGFKRLDYEWTSTGDGGKYYIWYWKYGLTGEQGDSFGAPHWYGADFAHDDLGIRK